RPGSRADPGAPGSSGAWRSMLPAPAPACWDGTNSKVEDNVEGVVQSECFSEQSCETAPRLFVPTDPTIRRLAARVGSSLAGERRGCSRPTPKQSYRPATGYPAR